MDSILAAMDGSVRAESSGSWNSVALLASQQLCLPVHRGPDSPDEQLIILMTLNKGLHPGMT